MQRGNAPVRHVADRCQYVQPTAQYQEVQFRAERAFLPFALAPRDAPQQGELGCPTHREVSAVSFRFAYDRVADSRPDGAFDAECARVWQWQHAETDVNVRARLKTALL